MQTPKKLFDLGQIKEFYTKTLEFKVTA
jgi:hypothetical protein